MEVDKKGALVNVVLLEAASVFLMLQCQYYVSIVLL